MQEAEEQDTCRICSAPGEPGQPLFYPCKCSGTIRYIHQDCLTTWLSHSKKKTCDVCKHPYCFTKVYAPDMPSSLPPLLLIRRLAQQAFFATLFGIRAILIAIVWLALLPWITIWTWRVYFTMGESTAWWISGRERPGDVRPIGFVQTLTANNETISSLTNATVLHRLASRAFWQTLSSDIFAGQIIASLIVLIFVAVFLLREWISQNVRPGVFEEEEVIGVPPQAPPVPNLPPPNQPVQDVNVHMLLPQRQVPLDVHVEARPQARLWRPHRPLPPNARFEGLQPQRVDERTDFLHDPIRQPQNPRVDSASVPQFPVAQYHRPPSPCPILSPTNSEILSVHTSKGKEKGVIVDSEPTTLDVQRHMRSQFDDGERDESMESLPDVGPSLPTASGSGWIPSLSTSGRSTVMELSPFEFTFRIPANGNVEEDIREPVPDIPAQSLVAVQTAMMTGTPIPMEEPRRQSIVFSPDVSFETLSAHAATLAAEDENDLKPSHDSSSPTSSHFSFMHLPVTDNSIVSEHTRGSSSYQHATSSEQFTTQATFADSAELLPVDSSSKVARNMDRRKRSREQMSDDFDHYFRDPQFVTLNPIGIDGDQGNLSRDGTHGVEHGRIADDEERLVLEAGHEDEDDSEDDEAPERVFWDADADHEDEEDDDEDVVDLGDFNLPDRAGIQAQPPPQAPVEQVNDGADDLEAGVEDDMEGALEAIGLRGPIFGVVQNVILMVFVLDTAIGFGVWLPFTLGKTAALLSLDPQRALYILHLPIRGMRIVTDPFVDFITLVLSRFLFPSFYKTAKFFLSGALDLVSHSIGGSVPQSMVSCNPQDITSWVASKRLELSAVASLWLQSPPQERPPYLAQRINNFFENNSTVAQLLGPGFAYVGREVRLFTSRFQQSWVCLALENGNNERAFAIVLGYGVIGIILALYLNVFTVGNAKTAGRAVRNAVRQQLLVVKVAMFIIIELIIFPLGCGIMLDGCTIWVFPEASLESRIAFFIQAPLTAMFYHWVAGTMFMYQFAVLLGGCRNIMRPGAMWFIKDPQDQNFHPIRDILDRPTFTQFRKLLISAFMYAMVVACGVGSLAILLFIGNRSIFPIRWKTREPLSEVPIDLLFLQIVLPYTMRYLRPRKAVYRVSVHVWKFLAARLRLTSYMFGERKRDEESSKVYKSWVAFLRRSTKDIEEMTTTLNGTFRRVPASDNIALPRDMRATAEVYEDGTPLNDKAAALIASQNAEAVKAKRNIKEDYIVVYFAPRFRTRIFAFVTAVWTIMAIVAAICIAVPMQVGRHFFELVSSPLVHDGYSFLAGFYILWACYLVGKAAQSMDRRRQRVTGDGPRADFAVYFAKQSLLWITKMAYMAAFLGVIIPILLGLVVDLYIVLPIRLTLHPTMVPTIRLVDMWSLGLVYCKIIIRLRRRLQLPRLRFDALHVLLNNGWTHPDPHHATKEIILPLLVTLLAMLLLPAGTVYVVRELLYIPLNKKFLFMHVYPGIFAIAGLSRMVISAMSVLSNWSQSIRDKEFLVEMRLQNLEPDDSEQKTGKETEAPRVGVVRAERAIAAEER